MKSVITFYLLLCSLYWKNASNNVLQQYTTVVTFGDSLSDSGRAYQLSNRTWPPVPPFNSNGGFADGLVWNQIFAQKLLMNATLRDFSCGSSTTDNELVQGYMSRAPNLLANYSIRSNTKAIGLRQQIVQYINSVNNETIDFDRTLYVIWTGTNNYSFNKTLTVLNTVQSLIDSINLLIIFGGRNLIMINEPPFDRFPEFQGKNDTNTTKQLFIDHNKLLAAKLSQTYSPSNTRLNIRLFDSYTFISTIMDNYTNYGFENLEKCWDLVSHSTVQVLCENITRRMFCDEYHFTSKMQLLFAEEFYRFLTLGQHVTYSTTIMTPSNVTKNTSFNIIVFMFVLIGIFF